MLSHVEVTARVTVTPAAHFVWSNRLDYTHDCLVCLRVGRVMQLQHGKPYGLCAGNEHPAPIRVSGFDTTDHGAERGLRCRISFWWAPFNDLTEPAVQASELSAEPWVQLNYRVGCHTCRDTGAGDWLGIEGFLRSGSGPVTTSCPRCATELVTAAGAPKINLV
ncbi:hypothetical protein UK23_03790 [Lentzea aerocolonigenes]|uniref:Uncharacterized protein n=1 Tax=Lentzea aerocolonigenes TaxID=68170 RepID=A0A0F0HD53_LENAE|nr:hypothetical protein [Lentzea aerocolonigenes]KJK52267.1 hypothetical protein UK23_03790 [Lentzea aerocolonigenes]